MPTGGGMIANPILRKRISARNGSLTSGVTRVRHVVQSKTEALQERPSASWKEWRQPSQITARELMSALIEAVCEGDVWALEGFLDSDVLSQGPFTEEQLTDFLEISRKVWGEHNSATRILLGAIMASLK